MAIDWKDVRYRGDLVDVEELIYLYALTFSKRDKIYQTKP